MMEQKELVIRLIKSDLKNQSIMNGFQALGFYSDDCYLNLSDTIFKVLDIDNDELFELYLEKCTELAGTDILMDLRRFIVIYAFNGKSCSPCVLSVRAESRTCDSFSSAISLHTFSTSLELTGTRFIVIFPK